MKIDSLETLYVHELKDLYNAEKQLASALPRMNDKATDTDLKQAFSRHLDETNGHIQRLEKIFEKLGESPTGETCEAMKGLIREAEDVMHNVSDKQVLDAALIAAAQRVEHYEIAGYGTARTYARRLNDNDAANLLQQTLDEESKTDKLLTDIAEQQANPRAQKA
ncbi:MAG: ferritin-like domain-containing protein [Bacteroidota bacterium]